MELHTINLSSSGVDSLLASWEKPPGDVDSYTLTLLRDRCVCAGASRFSDNIVDFFTWSWICGFFWSHVELVVLATCRQSRTYSSRFVLIQIWEVVTIVSDTNRVGPGSPTIDTTCSSKWSIDIRPMIRDVSKHMMQQHISLNNLKTHSPQKTKIISQSARNQWGSTFNQSNSFVSIFLHFCCFCQITSLHLSQQEWFSLA